MSVWALGSCALHFVCAGLPATAQTGKSAPPEGGHYEYRVAHDAGGIGKFYLGREIAKVMGHEGADWLERSERLSEEAPDLLLQELQVKATDVVADIGAGTGYFTRRLARIAGQVLAVDIQPQMLQQLTNSLSAAGLTNVVPVLGSVTNPGLQKDSLDLVLMVDVYHEFEFPFEMMQHICRALKTGGRVAFVEYRAEDPDVPIKPLHKMTEAQVIREMSVHELQWTQTLSVLPWQHLILFTRPAPGAMTPALPHRPKEKAHPKPRMRQTERH